MVTDTAGYNSSDFDVPSIKFSSSTGLLLVLQVVVMASNFHCVSTFPETTRFAKTVWLLGCVLESMAYGLLLLLAFTCFRALRKRKGGSPRVNRGLAIYTVVSAVLATVVEVVDLERTFYAVLDDTCVGPYMHVPHPYLNPSDIVSFMTTLLTDGLLVSTAFLTRGDAFTMFRFGGAMQLLQA